MRTLIVLLFSLLVSHPAWAGIVVWLHEELPEERMLRRSDARTGEMQHVSGWDLKFPPMPPVDTDQEAYDALRAVVNDGKKRWNDFEVEYGIARAVESALEKIDVIRTERDRAELVEALLFQGAAVQVAFEPDEFRDGERAAPFRVERTGGAGNRPWAEAIALMPDRELLPSDVADGATFPVLRQEVEQILQQPKGRLLLPRHAEGDVVVVDGRPVEGEAVSLLPGRHFVHVLREGERLAARRVVRVEPKREVQVLPYVSDEELAEARERVLAGTTTGFPDAVKSSLEKLAAQYEGGVFVAAYDQGRLTVLPWGHGATLLKQRKITAVTVGELGGALLSSPVFDGAGGRAVIAPGVHGSLGFELGILHAVLLGGVDLTLTPGKTITYANRDNTANIDTSSFLQPYGGLGLYLLRPTGQGATILVAGHYAWLYPSHHGIGGRFSLGLPLGSSHDTWVRFTIGATGASRSTWGTDDPMIASFLRVGLGSRL